MSATIASKTTWTIDDFEVSFQPVEHIDPKIERHDDGTVTVSYAVDDDDVRDFEGGDGIAFWQASSGYVSPDSREDVEAMPHVFQVERYEHGLSSYSLVADAKPYPDRQWDVGVCGLIGVSDDFTDPREAAAGWLSEYTHWANGSVYGLVRDTYARGGKDGPWVLTESDSCWGFIGTEYAQNCITNGDW